jgi:hypothetical protein
MTPPPVPVDVRSSRSINGYRQNRRTGGQTLPLRPFIRLGPDDRDAVLAGADALCAFIAPGSAPDIVLDDRPAG